MTYHISSHKTYMFYPETSWGKLRCTLYTRNTDPEGSKGLAVGISGSTNCCSSQSIPTSGMLVWASMPNLILYADLSLVYRICLAAKARLQVDLAHGPQVLQNSKVIFFFLFWACQNHGVCLYSEVCDMLENMVYQLCWCLMQAQCGNTSCIVIVLFQEVLSGWVISVFTSIQFFVSPHIVWYTFTWSSTWSG